MQLPTHITQFSRLCQHNKSSLSKVKFVQASNYSKMVLEAAKHAYANKPKECMICQKPGLSDFSWIAVSVLNKGKSTIFLHNNNSPEVVSSPSDKAKLFAGNLSKNCNVDDSGVSLSAFLSRTSLKRHVSLTPKLVKKVTTKIVFNWWFWRNMSLNFYANQMNFSVFVWANLIFQIARYQSLVTVFRRGWESTAENCHPVSFFVGI